MVVQVIHEEIPFTVTVYLDRGIEDCNGPDDSAFEVERIEFEGQDFTNLLDDGVIESIKEKVWEQIDG